MSISIKLYKLGREVVDDIYSTEMVQTYSVKVLKLKITSDGDAA